MSSFQARPKTSTTNHIADQLSPSGVTDPVIQFVMPIYALLLTTMAWRGLCRANSTLSRLTALGGVLFVISDALIVIHLFHTHLSFYQVITIGLFGTLINAFVVRLA